MLLGISTKRCLMGYNSDLICQKITFMLHAATVGLSNANVSVIKLAESERLIHPCHERLINISLVRQPHSSATVSVRPHGPPSSNPASSLHHRAQMCLLSLLLQDVKSWHGVVGIQDKIFSLNELLTLSNHIKKSKQRQALYLNQAFYHLGRSVCPSIHHQKYISWALRIQK